MLALVLSGCVVGGDVVEPPGHPAVEVYGDVRDVDDTADVGEPEEETEFPQPDEDLPPACVIGVAAHDGYVGYPTASDAFFYAPAGGTVVICPGDHVGQLWREGGWPLTVEGATGDPDDVRLIGVSGQAIFALKEKPVEITIRAVSGVPPPTPMLDTWFVGGTSGDQITIINAAFRVRGTSVTVNAVSAFLTVEDTTFEHQARAISFGGGPIVIGSLTIRRSEFFGGGAASLPSGSAIGVATSGHDVPVPVLIEDSLFEGNITYGDGTIAVDSDNTDMTILRTRFIDNVAGIAGDGIQGNGAGLHISANGAMGPSGSHGPILAGIFRGRIEDCDFIGNRAELGGSAIASGGGNPGSLHDVVIDIVNSRFARNISRADTTDWTGAVGGSSGTIFHLEMVDFGEGVNENVPGDMSNWPWQWQHLGQDVTMTVEPG